MLQPAMYRRFAQLFCELDGDRRQPRHGATKACIEALFDRVMNPPMLDDEVPIVADVDAAERTIIAMIQDEADYVRELLSWLTNQSYPLE